MKLKLSCKSLDSIKSCKRGKNSLLEQRSWFKNLFDSSMEVQCHHLTNIRYVDIQWFIGRFVLGCKPEDYTKIVTVIYDHVFSHGLEERYDNFIIYAIIRRVSHAQRNQDLYNAKCAISYMKYHDIMAIARKLLEIDYSCDYSNPDNWN